MNFQIEQPAHWAALPLPFVALALRYVLFAGGFYFVFYVWKSQRWSHRKIQTRFPSLPKIHSEIRSSITTLFIFGIVSIGIFLGKNLGIFQLYPDPDFLGWPYFFASFLILVFVHDTWFYWTHRLIHHPKLFKLVHATHHRSTNPSPWAAFSFHPLEALIEAAFLPILLLFLPINGLIIIAFMFFMITFNVIGHLGFEIYPTRFFKTWFGKWQNSSTHHNMHHQYNRHNFGLYFNFWDRIMGTNHPHYYERLEQILNKKKEVEEPEKAIRYPYWEQHFGKKGLL